MPPPTTAVYLNSTTPASPPGNQNVTFQSDGAQPEQSITAFPQLAVAGPGGKVGVVKPDGTSITQDPDGTIHAVVTGGSGGGTGGGGASASGGFEVVVVPSGAKDGSNTQYTLPAPVLAGTAPKYVRNGVVQRQLGTKAEFAVQGTTLTTTTPLQPDPNGDWHEFYYVQGTPNSEFGGGGTTPVGSPTFIQGNNNYSTGTTVSSTFSAANGAGNCLIVDVMFQEGFVGAGSLSISDSAGNSWTLAGGTTHEAGGIALIATWYALNCAAGPNTVTVTYSSSTPHPGMAIAIHEYAAVATASAFDVDAYGIANSTGGLPISLALTTTVAGDLLHISASGRGTGIPFTNSGGWTARETNNGGTLSITTFDALAGAAGSYSNNVSTTSVTAISMQGYLLALKSL